MTEPPTTIEMPCLFSLHDRDLIETRTGTAALCLDYSPPNHGEKRVRVACLKPYALFRLEERVMAWRARLWLQLAKDRGIPQRSVIAWASRLPSIRERAKWRMDRIYRHCQEKKANAKQLAEQVARSREGTKKELKEIRREERDLPYTNPTWRELPASMRR